MAKRDPQKTARNRIIAKAKEELRNLLPKVLADTGISGEDSLNATLGSKHQDFFDLKHDVVQSPEEFVLRWVKGLQASNWSAHAWIYQQMKAHASFRKYAVLFLRRSYLKHFEELAKVRPHVSSAEVWIGQKNADYGLLVSPRFRDGQWENDESEIRHFQPLYWTIGHVLETGLVVPGKKKTIPFSDANDYLNFFVETLVRGSGSKYEYAIAEHYAEFVLASDHPERVPLLIPEFRYGGPTVKHKYRLDFLITDPFTMDRYGFELSPWSTHGYLSNTKQLTQAEINELAKDNFAKEMRKHRSYFKKHGVVVLIFTDDMLPDTKMLFDQEMVPRLTAEEPQSQLSFTVMEEINDLLSS